MLNGRTSNGFKDKVRSGADAYTRCGGGESRKVSFEMFYREKMWMWSKTDNFEDFLEPKTALCIGIFQF